MKQKEEEKRDNKGKYRKLTIVERCGKWTIGWVIFWSVTAGASWTYVYDHRNELIGTKTITIEVAHAEMAIDAQKDTKAPQNAKIEANTTAYSEIETCVDEECKMANGKKAHVGSVACPRSIKLGTKILIDDKQYECEDRTALQYDGRFDIFMGYGKESNQKAINYGIQSKTITIL